MLILSVCSADKKVCSSQASLYTGCVYSSLLVLNSIVTIVVTHYSEIVYFITKSHKCVYMVGGMYVKYTTLNYCLSQQTSNYLRLCLTKVSIK